MAEAQPSPLEAEPDEWADNDLAIGSTSVASSTASLTSTIMKHREENGRTYHAYKDGSYNFPNDEGEKDRLDLQHHLFGLIFDGKLFLAPIPKEKALHRVLDVGCGTGIWAIDFADDHPESQVLGVDLSHIQPQSVPPNVSFQVDDLEEPWSFNYKFDFIYSRMMTGSFLDYPRFFEQCYENLDPGGWIECADICFPPLVDDDSLPPDSAFMKWALLMMDACERIGRRSDAQKEFPEQLKAARFKDVTVVKYVWPQNRWPKDKHLKMLGAWQLENFCGGLTGMSVALFTRVLGMSTEEVTVFLALVAKEMKDTKIHAYWPISIVYGHKE